MRFRKGWIISTTTILILLNAQRTNAQTDFPISVLTSLPTQLNPAATGLFGDAFRIHSYFKSQVARSLAGGIKGTGLAVDYNLNEANMGLWLVVFSNSVNKSALRDFNVLLSYGYRVNLSKRSMLSFGVQGGFKQVGFSLEELNFGSQYDPTYKGGFNPNRRPDYLDLSNRNGFDASAGAYWQVHFNPDLAMKTGVAAFHMIPVKTDFLNEDTYLKPKYVFSANARFRGYYLHWIPSAMYVAQNNHSYAEIGLTSQFRDMDKFSNVGIYYRNPNVIIPTIGIGLDRLSINLSLEYYLRSSYSQILNIGILYVPQTGKKVNLVSGFMDI